MVIHAERVLIGVRSGWLAGNTKMPACPKPARVVNPALIQEILDEQGCCLVGQKGAYDACSDPGIDMHHIASRRSGGGDIRGNLIRVCRHHHQMIHAAKIPRSVLYLYLEEQ
jgi:hypothetical protein